jgi:uncharacterized protein (TIGR02266 family)
VAPPNSVRIRLRYLDLDTFVEKFAPNVTRGGVFLASRNIQPVGTTVAFEIQLASGEVALSGQGKVTWVKEFNPAEPTRPYGMGVQFLSVDAATKPTLTRVLRAKESGSGSVPARRPTGQFGSGSVSAAGVAGGGNGKPAGPAVDTSVDLAAEYGLDPDVLRRVIDRTWMSGVRGSDDLGDLVKPEPMGTATLEQALAELPRLLDPQYSRRRATGAFRPIDLAGAGSAATASRAPAQAVPQTEPAAEASETTDMGVGPVEGGIPDAVTSPEAGSAEGASSGNGRRSRKKRR